MSDEQDEPPWDCLPHDPLGFFGLPRGVEEGVLKRAYRDLIRRYRPEHDPESFQRIREAYEAALPWAGGGPSSSPFGPTFPQPAPGDSGRALRAELESSGLDALERRLATAGQRSPQEEVAHLLLRDASHAMSEPEFATALIEAAGRHPGSADLGALVREQLATGVPAGSLPPLLRRAASDLDPGDYFHVTPDAWRRALGAMGAGDASRLLDDLEWQHAAGDPAASAWFRVRLLLSAACVLEPADLAARIRDLTGELPLHLHLDDDLDVLEAVAEFRAWDQETGSATGTTGQRLRDAVRALCTEEDAVHQEHFDAAFAAMAAEPDRVLADLEPGGADAMQRLRVLDIMARDLHDETVDDDEGRRVETERRLAAQTIALTDRRFVPRLHALGEGALRLAELVTRGLLILSGLMFLPAVFGDVDPWPWRVVAALGGLALLSTATLGWRRFGIAGFIARRRLVGRRLMYRRWFRGDLRRFLAVHRLHSGAFRRVYEREPEGSRAEFMAAQAMVDPGLHVLSLAYRYGLDPR